MGIHVPALCNEALHSIKCETVGDAQAFLHGFCGFFALALAEDFGYPITVYAEPAKDEDDPVANRIIHIYCHSGNNYIDVRGVSTDEPKFLDEFADFISRRPEWDDVIEGFPIDDLTDMLSGMCTEDEFARIMTDAKQLIKNYHNIYSVNE